MERTLTVRDYMTRDVVVLAPDMDLHEAVRLFVAHDISGAPVMDARGALVGILAEKDCFRAAVRSSYYAEPWGDVAAYMSSPVETIDADMTLVEVVEHFYRGCFRRYPVLTNGRLVGLISRRDVLRVIETLA